MKITQTEIKINNLVNKKYRYMQKKRNQFLALATANLGFAAYDAIYQRAFMTVLMGTAGIMSLKIFENCVNEMLMLKSDYKEIKDRAKNINSIRKLNMTV